VRKALGLCKASFLSAGFFSLFINLLLLVPTIYMLQIYDRVLPSGSLSTLLMLSLIAVFLFLALGGLEWIRSQILVVTSNRIDQLLAGRVHDALFAVALATSGRTATAQPIGDLGQLRQFLTGPGLFAFFDAPWIPTYLAVMFLFHPFFGVAGSISAAVLVALAIWNELATRKDLEQANREALDAGQATQRNLRNAEVVEAMGMLAPLRERWLERQRAVLKLQGRASGWAGTITALSKSFRLTTQSLVLGLGAYLAIRKEVTPGAVIAGAILLGRALAPVDQMINTWRGFLAARVAYHRLTRLLESAPVREPPMRRPAPRGEIRLDGAVVTPPGGTPPGVEGHQPRRRARDSAGRHRPQRSRKVHPRTRDPGSLPPEQWQHPPRWSRSGPVGPGATGRSRRLPAPGRGAPGRHHQREHRPLPGGRPGAGGQGGDGCGHPRDGAAPAGRLPDADRRPGGVAVRRAAPAAGPRPCTLEHEQAV
jgi:ATP-binding cassette subfamily C protein EexD